MFDVDTFADIATEWAERLSYHAELVSTNDEAISAAKAGAEHGTVVLAEAQTKGRGRRGSAWISNAGDGLLFSIIVRPKYAREHWSRLALATGLGVASCLRDEWTLTAEVKWPNDVYISGKKCCGILVEAREDFAVIGVGVNVGLSPEVADCTSIWEELGKPVAREEVFADLLNSIIKEVSLCGGDSFTDQLSRLRSVCMLTGKQVTFQSSGRQYEGKFMGIGTSGEIRVDVCGDVTAFLQADTVRVV